MKLASLNYDVTDYAMNEHLEKIAEAVQSLSDQAKMANIPDYTEQLEHPQKDFAVVLWDRQAGELNKFACYTPELTEINMAFLINNMNTLPEEIVKVAAANLTCSAKKFKITIPEELSKYASSKFVKRLVDLNNIDTIAFNEKLAACNPKKEAPKKTALHGKYPINSKEEIKKAAAWFDKNHTSLNIEDKMEFVNNIKTAAAELEVPIEKTAVAIYTNLDPNKFNEDLYAHIGVRKSYFADDNEESKEAYDEVLRRADELGPIKTAYLIEILDEETNLKGTYGKRLTDPLVATLGLVKVSGLEIDGSLVTMKDLQKLSPASLTELVGNDMIKDIKGPDGLEVVASLPRPIRSELLSLMGK
jgi:hypothetical protein